MAGIKKATAVVVPILVLVAVIVIVFYPFSKGSSPEGMVISAADSGSVIRAIPGEGTLVPQSEVIILSPASSIIKGIMKEVGSHVEAGEAILILDPSPIQEEVDRIRDQLEVMENALQKNLLNARSTRVDLDYNVQVKKLNISSLESELADQEQLLEVGGISPARFEKTKQELELARQDLKMIQEKNYIRLQQLEAEEKGLRLQIEIQEKALASTEKLLGQMIVRAPSAGIILSVKGKIGEKVSTDKLLVEMSDLSNFKIKGSAGDDYSNLIKTGTKVYVKIEDLMLKGAVGTVSPVIRDRKVEFDVYLEESNHWRLRPNLTVGLDIVMEERDSVLRVASGPAFGKGNEHEVFVVEDELARKRVIRTGLRSPEYIEVVEGLEPGERVIISDISAFRNKNEIEL
ncbi:MAG: HlyD family efflux transporter periplasmic adaptor subunit [Bacteroidales bacterium]|nr:HlyD family efflux transporter periplasmic adaptor subunit [Bacteroidales bacterium]MBN2698621.1 HlyD family efflux transporter periplasmic adaptor subunit [Bacteroidales bacterium]